MAAPARVGNAGAAKPLAIESPKTYHHQTLDTSSQQIRLIKLHLNQGGPPACKIGVFELSSAPPFVALSYTWGPPSPQFDILVNGEPLSIRENLFQFLQNYLATAPAHYLWIDQICIDQSSVRERNHQVGMMASIYSGCQQTLIWLGEINTDLIALSALNNTEDLFNPPDGALKALSSVASNDYFTRLWVVQEIILSDEKTVLCSHLDSGPFWVNWDKLCAVARIHWHLLPSIATRSVLKQHVQNHRMTLFDAILSFSKSFCQDPRDKVYGLMGLVKHDQRLTIDYEQSMEDLLLESMTVFYKELASNLYYSYPMYHDALVDLGGSWGIKPASLDAFLYDVWTKPAHDWNKKFGSDPPGPVAYPHIQAMGFLPTTTDQNTKLQSEELLPYSMSPERYPGYLETSYWIPTKDCWWYQVDGTIYEIYGLISSEPRLKKSPRPGYYVKRVRKTHRDWKSRIHLPSWVDSRLFRRG